MPKEISPEDARQGRRGIHLLLMLIGGLILVVIVWAVADLYVFEAGRGHPPAGTRSAQQQQPASPPPTASQQHGTTAPAKPQ